MQLTGNELHHLPAEFTRVNSFFAGSKMCLARGQPLAAIRKMLVIARALQAKGAKGGKAGHKGLPSRARAAEGTGLHVHLVMGNDKFLVGFKLPQHAVGRVFHAPVDVVGVKKVQEIMQRQVQDVGCLHAGSGKTGQGRLAPGCIAISQRRWPAGAFTGTGASATRRCGMHPAHSKVHTLAKVWNRLCLLSTAMMSHPASRKQLERMALPAQSSKNTGARVKDTGASGGEEQATTAWPTS